MPTPFKHKIPIESNAYPQDSAYICTQISYIIQNAIESQQNRIFIYTNLKRGLPLENINKVAGPFVEAWALEQFEAVQSNPENSYHLIHVDAGRRLDPFDIVLQFKKEDDHYCAANVDVKATSEDIPTAGRSPNITSYKRIRNEYLEDPDYIFVILSLKHRVYSEQDPTTQLTKGVMEVVAFTVYDLKYIAKTDLSYNPALGTGQLQIRDIHYVDIEERTTWEFLQLIDEKFIRSKGESAWLELAQANGWIKEDE
jgi:hypothetical protein